MFMLTVVNAPVRNIARALVPAERSSDSLDLLMMFAVVLVNGAIYGLIVWAGVKLWRGLMARRSAP
jgi:hypothetical protein